MNWILIVAIVLLAEQDVNHITPIFGLASPLPITGPNRMLNPYILHWEAANFDRLSLENAHQYHLGEKERRRKRDLTNEQYGTANTIKLNFRAHDKEFRLVLHQDPLSVFMPDAEIENTDGPVDYDISRIYTGSLEDDENSRVHAVLTKDNLIDGTISTSTEQYYLEPSSRYSKDLEKNSGIHTIVYKLSDVKMKKSIMPSISSSSSSSTSTTAINTNLAEEHCASEKLRRKLLYPNELKRRKKSKTDQILISDSDDDISSSSSSTSGSNSNSGNKKTNINDSNKRVYNKLRKIDVKSKNYSYDHRTIENHDDDDNDNDDNKGRDTMSHDRHKRWLPDELSENRDPPLPLDLDVPFNDDYSTYNRNFNQHNNSQQTTNYKRSDMNNNNYRTLDEQPHNIGDLASGNSIYINNRNRNILINQYSPINNNNNNNQHNNNPVKSDFNNNFNNGRNNLFNSNLNNRNIIVNNYNSSIMNSGSRPSHKTHVEIITKNGATKKSNIIVNNYNPDSSQTIQNIHNINTNNINNNLNSHLNLNIRNDLSDSILSSSSSSSSTQQQHHTNSGIRSLYDRKSTCMLYLQADHTFFQKMGSDEASIEAITRHVQRANSIYKNTDFNGDGKPDNITFMIKRIKVHNSNALKDPGYRFPGNYGVEKFLELFSEEDYDAFCLAYMFTYRDFEMGTLGLAWTGDLKNAGGVCEKNGHYRGSLKSLNTGIVTLLNYGKHVPPAVSHVTLAHEIGHNFGSPHDPEQCTPGGEDGNYIMFARATSGDKRNNNKFSPCSLKSIEPVLNAKARSAKGCFTEPQTSICGNGVVEPGEQCDCGWEEDCKDDCCHPMSRHPRSDEKPCTLLPNAKCSPSQGPCCTNQCSLKFGDKCRDDNGCRDPSYCDGSMPQCPPSVNKPNKTICNKEFVCFMGECTGSICLAYGLESCQCLPGPTDPKTKSCELCCKEPGEGKVCKSSFQWNEPPFDVPDMFAKPGTPCNDYNGYCDVFQKCREVDPSGPLATLRKLLLSEESLASFRKWIQSNWYTVVLAAIGVVVLLVLSTKLLGKRNVKLKSVTIIHSATTETVRLPEDNNGVIVHTAIRTKVPFKKKVRGQRTKKSSSTKIITKKSTQQTIKNPGSGGGGGGGGSSGTIAGGNNVATTITANNGAPGISATAMMIPTKVLKKRNSDDVVMKKVARKKNRVPAPVGVEESNAITTKISDLKKLKKNKKHKEIIDYSKTSSINGSSNPTNHTNTFGKVQKWLLDSPIVSQPLSHIEHSSKVRKVMSKSQSTPERLVQKSPQKTKSVGNLSNEKVKLQVVYKPPFKFSLKLSKNSAVKTHVIGGALSKSKRKSRSGDKKRNGAVGPLPTTAAIVATGGTAMGKISSSVSAERGHRAALLLRTNNENDNQLLKLVENSEPNYETLNLKSSDKSPLYENMQVCATGDENNLNSKNISGTQNFNESKLNRTESNRNSSTNAFRISRSVSNSNIDNCGDSNHKNSITNINNPFTSSSTKNNSRKFSDNSMNLNRNYGSTQNLLQSSTSNLTKTKKRSSLNLKSSSSNGNNYRNSFQNSNNSAATKRSNSNLNLKRENSSSNLRRDGSVTNLIKTSSQINRVPSINNIPRASLSANGHHSRTPTPPNMLLRQHSAHNNANISSNNNSLSKNNLVRPHTASCDVVDHQRQFEWPKIFSNSPNVGSATSVTTAANPISSITTNNTNSKNLTKSKSITNNDHKTNNSKFTKHNNHKNVTKTEDSLPSDLEVMVSDIENLVS